MIMNSEYIWTYILLGVMIIGLVVMIIGTIYYIYKDTNPIKLIITGVTTSIISIILLVIITSNMSTDLYEVNNGEQLLQVMSVSKLNQQYK